MPAKKEYKDFESAIGRLEEIVTALETGEHTLEDSIDLYSEGIKIAGICNKKLTDAEGKIARLSKQADQFQVDKLTGEDNE
jgi:exodeoxyribonuclease VII small subunit